MRLTRRVEALEHGAQEFHGYAVVYRQPGETVDQACAAWEAENGPVGAQQFVVFNFGDDPCN